MSISSELLGTRKLFDRAAGLRSPTELLPAWQGRRILRLLNGEVQATARLIAATTSVVNALADHPEASVPQEALMAFLPPDPDTTMIRQLTASELSLDLVALLQEFYIRLGVARTMTIAFCRSPANVRHKGGVHVEVLAGVWRGLCEHTVMLIDTLLAVQRATNGDDGLLPEPGVVELLVDCADGQRPCVMADNSVEVPGLAERRTSTRWPVEWPAMLAGDAAQCEAHVVNLSSGGLHLEADIDLDVGQGVRIVLANGTSLEGEVVWSQGRAHGVRFPAALTMDDPLITWARHGVQPA